MVRSICASDALCSPTVAEELPVFRGVRNIIRSHATQKQLLAAGRGEVDERESPPRRFERPTRKPPGLSQWSSGERALIPILEFLGWLNAPKTPHRLVLIAREPTTGLEPATALRYSSDVTSMSWTTPRHAPFLLATTLALLSLVGLGCTPSTPQAPGSGNCVERQATSTVDDACRRQCGSRAFRQCNDRHQWECRCAPPAVAPEQAEAPIVANADNLGAADCPFPTSTTVFSSHNGSWSVRRDCSLEDSRPQYKYSLTNNTSIAEVPGTPIGFSPDSRFFLFEGVTAADDRDHLIAGISSLELSSSHVDFEISRRITNRISGSSYLQLLQTYHDRTLLPESFLGFITPDDGRFPLWRTPVLVDVPTTRGWVHVDLSNSSATLAPP